MDFWQIDLSIKRWFSWKKTLGLFFNQNKGVCKFFLLQKNLQFEVIFFVFLVGHMVWYTWVEIVYNSGEGGDVYLTEFNGCLAQSLQTEKNNEKVKTSQSEIQFSRRWFYTHKTASFPSHGTSRRGR
jgi:hypothetical protein